MVRILGIDPGSQLTGYGCVEWDATRVQHVAHGTWRLGRGQSVSFEDRLLQLHQSLLEGIRTFEPQVVVVEKVFFAKNAASALKLGQVRGVVLLTARLQGASLAEYAPTEVKAALTGHGGAEKAAVAQMLRLQFAGQNLMFETLDASDALALAVCHAHRSRFEQGRSVKLPSGKKVSLQELMR
jgi:crossover junction endodeoxyribonuclease RuvC